MIRLRHLKLASRFVVHRFRELHPFEVQASLLNACNLRCVYCTCPDNKTALMTTDQWKTIIRHLGVLGTMRIKFQGGEPTLRRDFRELCAEAQQAGIITAVTTNGLQVVIRPELLDYLDEVVFSLDAVTPEVHDNLRGHGTHAQVVQAIDIAHERGRGLQIIVNMTVCRENLAELEPMLEFCEARGIMVHMSPVIYSLKYSDLTAQHLALTNEQAREMHHRLAQWKRDGRGLLFSLWSYQKAADWSDITVLTTQSSGDSPCMSGKDYIHIEPNGDVHPCGLHNADFTPKNILADGLIEALHHVRRHNCGDCWVPTMNERKAVFGLKPAALREVIRRG